jgi:2-polyprenyl-3-methyl-5-hydroxy-6-metoxy-1,4-benzoquinol methylase
VFTDSFYTSAGLAELFLNANASQLAGGDVERQRALWAPVVQRVLDVMPQHAKPFDAELRWIDVGCGSGGLVFTAEEFGFDATGIDLRQEAVRRILERGYKAHCAALFSVQSDSPIHVISMADLLEHTSHPVAVLLRANEMLEENGVLFISCPNRESSGWREMDRKNTNPYWSEIEHHHNFSRKSIMWLLQQCGFVPMNYAVSMRYIACMEIIAVKTQVPASHAPLLRHAATDIGLRPAAS